MAQKQLDTDICHIRVERVVGELLGQRPFVFTGGYGKEAIVFPVEYLTQAQLGAHKNKPMTLLLTGARARALGFKTWQTSLALNVNGLACDAILALADPAQTRADKTLPTMVSYQDSQLLSLAKLASLLPALLLINDTPPDNLLHVSHQDIAQYFLHPTLDIIETASTALPLKYAENTRIVSFRNRHCASVHLALIVGDIAKEKNPLVRVHSACVTGDILGSLRCDCGDQLQMSLAKIIEEGAGILLYLHQEGRGIGITNKLRAYRLQEQGFDTFIANQMLGFDDDERDFAIAAAMLKKLGAPHIRLLTNNPQKIKNLEHYGISVIERVALVSKPGKHNHAYLEAKAKKAGKMA